MGSCFSDNKSSRAISRNVFSDIEGDPKNPITKAIRNWNLALKRQQWEDNEALVLDEKLGTHNKTISFQEFESLFESLRDFSAGTRANIYELFSFESKHKQLSRKDFLIAYVLLKKSDDQSLLADMFFFVYSSEKDKSFMRSSDFNLFLKEFKEFQLDFKSTRKVPTKNEKGEILVDKEEFRQIFQQYDIRSIRKIFDFNLDQEERMFKKKLLEGGIEKITGERVYIVDFRWFLKWKQYFEMKYACTIKMKENGRPINVEQQSRIASYLQRRNSITREGQMLAREAKSKMTEIDNHAIEAEEPNELKENLVEFQGYACVPEWVWRYFRVLYGGGPPIRKVYPNVYSKRVSLVFLEEKKMVFYQNYIKTIRYEENDSFESVFNQRYKKGSKYLNPGNFSVYFKYPGKTDWQQVPSLNTKINDAPMHFRNFIVFVEKSRKNEFESIYNTTLTKDNQKQIKRRILNYGSMLNFEHDGVLCQGYVGNIFSNSVIIYYKDQKGKFLKVEEQVSYLKNQNPSIFSEESYQSLAGLQNIGNTCYMNAVIQCLIRTPYFGDYLEAFDYGNNKKDFLTYQIHEITLKSRASRECIDMSKFKRKFDEFFSYFQGYAQHDSQEFLLLLLDKISQEKQVQSNSVIRSGNSLKTNETIMRFFSGKTESTITCLKCKNKGVSTQPFFTCSLNLPIIKDRNLEFLFVDENFKVKLFSIIVRKNLPVSELTYKICQTLNIKKNNLFIQSAFEGEWNDNLNLGTYNTTVESLNKYDTNLLCYKVQTVDEPQYDDFRSSSRKVTVKIEVRNRVYDRRRREYSSFYYPFYVEVDEESTGKSLLSSLNEKINRFVQKEEFEKWKKDFEQNSAYQKQSKENARDVKQSLFPQEYTPGQEIEPFTIKFIRQSRYYTCCWFCRKDIDDMKSVSEPDSYCAGCKFEADQRLFSTLEFKRSWSTVVIVVDWRSQTFLEGFRVEDTDSCFESESKLVGKSLSVENLLENTSNEEQIIEFRCQKDSCRHNQVSKKQKIVQTPNILILHLKRFQFEDGSLEKMNNKVTVPEELSVPGQYSKYELYGNVVHYGTGRGGHYINFVKVDDRWFKCDDEKVYEEKNGGQLNDQAYILFYKKRKFESKLQILKF